MAILRTRPSRRATMVVEAAIILPVLVVASMAFLEYSYIMQKRQQIENACRNGARVGSRLL